VGAWLEGVERADEIEASTRTSVLANTVQTHLNFSIEIPNTTEERLEHKKWGAREGLPIFWAMLEVRK
jgi:hypothetical protein